MAAWEPWALLWLAVFQFTAALWYREGPHIGTTKNSVFALFILNGCATLVLGVATLSGLERMGLLADAIDIWTNAALLALAVALVCTDRPPRWAQFLVAFASVVLLVPTASVLLGPSAVPVDPAVVEFARELPLLSAIIITSVALVHRPLGPGRALIGGVLAMRFGELAVSTFAVRFARDWLEGPSGQDASDVLRMVAALSILVALAGMLVSRGRSAGNDRAICDLSAGFVVAGLLIGVARVQVPNSATLLYFTIAFVRPLAFLAAQSIEAGQGLFGDLRWRHVQLLTLAGTIGTGGLYVGMLVWDLSIASSTMVAAAVALVIYLAARAARTSSTPKPPGTTTGTGEVQSTATEEQALLAHPEVHPQLARLAYWERLAVAVYACKQDPADAPARSTAALALATGVPAGSIGAEATRTNRRTTQDGAGADGVFLTTWGRSAGGSRKPAKHYRLTRSGEDIARAIIVKAGLPSDSSVLREQLWPATASPVDMSKIELSKGSEADSALGEPSGP